MLTTVIIISVGRAWRDLKKRSLAENIRIIRRFGLGMTRLIILLLSLAFFLLLAISVSFAHSPASSADALSSDSGQAASQPALPPAIAGEYIAPSFDSLLPATLVFTACAWLAASAIFPAVAERTAALLVVAALCAAVHLRLLRDPLQVVWSAADRLLGGSEWDRGGAGDDDLLPLWSRDLFLHPPPFSAQQVHGLLDSIMKPAAPCDNSTHTLPFALSNTAGFAAVAIKLVLVLS
jgi:hypothetical protein